ncbi:MAG TPA: MG2 domain-containing protein, partial [Caulobacterales bacterium]|nr:MG2 domain-containing protein [Caulobacterales bacterium]
MNRNAILAAMVALFVGLWGGAVLGRVGGGGVAPFSTPGGAGSAEKIRAADAPRPGPARYEGMAFVRLRLDTTTEQPKACLEFSQDLATDPNIHYADYLQISPDTPVTAQAVGNQLCLGGLPFEPDHEITIRQGLPGKSGQRTTKDEQITVAFGDRPAFVGFSGNGVILPRTDADGLAIETVNVSKVKIEVLRVSDRILTRETVNAGEAIAEGSYDWWDFENAGEDNGAPVYKGALDIKLKDSKGDHHNETLTTVFPLGAALKEFKPGAYVVKVQDASPGAGANGDGDRPAAAHRWIIYTDMALQTFEGATGMDVVVRSLETAKPLAGVTLTLIASNNDELGRARTDGDGRVRFPEPLMKGEGALRARYVMAYGAKGDFAALDLERPTLDLSDRDVDGRAMPGDVDAYMYTDRGIYRPGEVVRLSGMLRDPAGRAIANRQSVLVVYRPNGTEARRDRLDYAKDAGAIIKNIWLDKSAPRGVWRAALLVDGQEAEAGSVSFSVEDFVPQRLAVNVDVKDKRPMRPGETRPIHVDAQFLYGAPGAGLNVEGEVRLQVEPTPFAAESAKGFSFGREEENFEEKFIQLNPTVTDGQGQADLAFTLTDAPDTSLPLRAKGVATVFEPGGRTVR